MKNNLHAIKPEDDDYFLSYRTRKKKKSIFFDFDFLPQIKNSKLTQSYSLIKKIPKIKINKVIYPAVYNHLSCISDKKSRNKKKYLHKEYLLSVKYLKFLSQENLTEDFIEKISKIDKREEIEKAKNNKNKNQMKNNSNQINDLPEILLNEETESEGKIKEFLIKTPLNKQIESLKELDKIPKIDLENSAKYIINNIKKEKNNIEPPKLIIHNVFFEWIINKISGKIDYKEQNKEVITVEYIIDLLNKEILNLKRNIINYVNENEKLKNNQIEFSDYEDFNSLSPYSDIEYDSNYKKNNKMTKKIHFEEVNNNINSLSKSNNISENYIDDESQLTYFKNKFDDKQNYSSHKLIKKNTQKNVFSHSSTNTNNSRNVNNISYASLTDKNAEKLINHSNSNHRLLFPNNFDSVYDEFSERSNNFLHDSYRKDIKYISNKKKNLLNNNEGVIFEKTNENFIATKKSFGKMENEYDKIKIKDEPSVLPKIIDNKIKNLFPNSNRISDNADISSLIMNKNNIKKNEKENVSEFYNPKINQGQNSFSPFTERNKSNMISEANTDGKIINTERNSNLKTDTNTERNISNLINNIQIEKEDNNIKNQINTERNNYNVINNIKTNVNTIESKNSENNEINLKNNELNSNKSTLNVNEEKNSNIITKDINDNNKQEKNTLIYLKKEEENLDDNEEEEEYEMDNDELTLENEGSKNENKKKRKKKSKKSQKIKNDNNTSIITISSEKEDKKKIINRKNDKRKTKNYSEPHSNYQKLKEEKEDNKSKKQLKKKTLKVKEEENKEVNKKIAKFEDNKIIEEDNYNPLIGALKLREEQNKLIEEQNKLIEEQKQKEIEEKKKNEELKIEEEKKLENEKRVQELVKKQQRANLTQKRKNAAEDYANRLSSGKIEHVDFLKHLILRNNPNFFNQEKFEDEMEERIRKIKEEQIQKEKEEIEKIKEKENSPTNKNKEKIPMFQMEDIISEEEKEVELIYDNSYLFKKKNTEKFELRKEVKDILEGKYKKKVVEKIPQVKKEFKYVKKKKPVIIKIKKIIPKSKKKLISNLKSFQTDYLEEDSEEKRRQLEEKRREEEEERLKQIRFEKQLKNFFQKIKALKEEKNENFNEDIDRLLEEQFYNSQSGINRLLENRINDFKGKLNNYVLSKNNLRKIRESYLIFKNPCEFETSHNNIDNSFN